jgi:predicted nucleic acid-binding protein
VIVVDASVTLAWCFGDEESSYANAVLDRVVNEGATAPAHWPLEVANALIAAERRSRIDEEGIADASRLLDRLGIEIVPVELMTATWSVLDTARAHALSAYDAAYLDLARFRGIPLATLDEKLRGACRSTSVDLVD